MQLKDNRYYLLASSQLFPIDRLSHSNNQTENKEDEAILLAHSALAHYRDGRKEEAFQRYTLGIKDFPDQPFFYAARAILNRELGDEEGSFYDYQVAKRLDFNYHIFLEWLENRPAITTIKDTGNDLKTILNDALDATQQFDYEGAQQLYTTAIELSPKSADAYVYRGAIYMRLLRYDLALNDFNSALVIDSQYFQGFISRAKFYESINVTTNALDDFNMAVNLSPSSSLVYEERGNFLVNQMSYREAICDFNALVNLLPEDFYVYTLRADVWEKLDEWREALEDYDKAISLNPYYSDLYAYRADVKEKLGDVQGAAEDRLLFEEIEAEE
ncbi:tetratricopeptide repeat protein [Sphingobacterium sp. LRF_L2]|uniref:tetratricopeptide repeat protein n=1 Tax=Sphingobacterium sp. LRF_L2 TaxID=3369421 RepID=UPI003F60AF11